VTRPTPAARELTPIILSIGLVFAINVVAFGVLWDALTSQESGLSENATQILTTAFGGIIGVLGSALGYRQASNRADELDARDDERADAGSVSAGTTRGRTMSTQTPEPRDPATDPDRNLQDQPQDPDAPAPGSGDEGTGAGSDTRE
jgi:hypothetical protein